MPLRVSLSGGGIGVAAPSKSSPLCRSRLTLATGLSLLLLTLVGSTLLVRLSLEERGATLEGYGAGGGPPGTAALNAPPGSFAHRLRSSWKVLTNLAQQKRSGTGAATSAEWSSNESGATAAVERIPNAGAAAASHAAAGASASLSSSSSSLPRLAVPRPQRKIASARDAAARHAAEVAAAAAVAAPSAPAASIVMSKLAEFESESEAPLSAPAAALVVEEQTSSLSGALAFVRDALRAPALLQPGIDERAQQALTAPHPTPSQGLRLALDHLAGRPPPALGSPLSPRAGPSPAPLVVPAPPGPDSPLRGLVVATRFWAASERDLASLQRFLERTLPHVERVLVALNVERDSADTMGFLAGLRLPLSRVQVVAVTPWLGVSSALNALALSAAKLNASRVLFQSVEVSLSEAQLRALVHEFDSWPDQLVVGPVLDGHAFEETRAAHGRGGRGGSDDDDEDDDGVLAGLMHAPDPLSSVALDDTTSHEIDGHNAPWNTAALWHLPTLLQTGFLTVADGFPRGLHQVGQEEVPTINLLQALATGAATHRYARRGGGGSAGNGGASSAPGAADLHRGRVTLLHVGEVSWTHSFASASARKEWHEQKMRSKLARAAHHMAVLGAGLHPGRVEHRIARVHHEAAQTHQTHHQPRTQIMLSDTSIQHETTRTQTHAATADLHSGAALAPANAPLSTSASGDASLLESAGAPSLASPLVDGSSSASSDGAAAAAFVAPVPPIPTRRVKRSALHGLRARGHPGGGGGASSSAGGDRDPHAADEPMHVKIKRHIPIGR